MKFLRDGVPYFKQYDIIVMTPVVRNVDKL